MGDEFRKVAIKRQCARHGIGACKSCPAGKPLPVAILDEVSAFRFCGATRVKAEKFAMAHGLLDSSCRIRDDQSADGRALRFLEADYGRR